jgi:hypothetical protein
MSWNARSHTLLLALPLLALPGLHRTQPGPMQSLRCHPLPLWIKLARARPATRIAAPRVGLSLRTRDAPLSTARQP